MYTLITFALNCWASCSNVTFWNCPSHLRTQSLLMPDIVQSYLETELKSGIF